MSAHTPVYSPALRAVLKAIKRGELSMTARCIVAWLALAHGGSAWLYRADIAAELGLSKDSVDDALRRLRRLGWLTVTGAPQGSRRQRLYTLTGLYE